MVIWQLLSLCAPQNGHCFLGEVDHCSLSLLGTKFWVNTFPRVFFTPRRRDAARSETLECHCWCSDYKGKSSNRNDLPAATGRRGTPSGDDTSHGDILDCFCMVEVVWYGTTSTQGRSGRQQKIFLTKNSLIGKKFTNWTPISDMYVTFAKNSLIGIQFLAICAIHVLSPK